jgi:hypothetical protein
MLVDVKGAGEAAKDGSPKPRCGEDDDAEK